jgi:transposase
MTIVENTRGVIGGVDTHLDVHVAAGIDVVGGVLGVESFPTTEQGYRRLIGWLGSLGPVMLVGVEGTGSYGAGLTRELQRAGIEVVEVDRPNRQARHRAGKSDLLDASRRLEQLCRAPQRERRSRAPATSKRSAC